MPTEFPAFIRSTCGRKSHNGVGKNSKSDIMAGPQESFSTVNSRLLLRSCVLSPYSLSVYSLLYKTVLASLLKAKEHRAGA